jgi:hypothetical protein
MLGRRMANIIKRLARHRDDMRLAKFQRARGLDTEWKLLLRPTKHYLPNLAPFWANRYLKLDMNNPADREKLRRSVLDLVAGRKMPKKKGHG